MADLSIVGQILLKLQGRGGLDAAAQLDKTDAAARRSARGLGIAEGATRSLGSTFTRFLGTAAVASFVRTSLTAFAEYERQLRTTGAQAKRLGLDQEQAKAQTKAFVEELERSSGIVRQDLLPAFNQLLGLTRDVGEAQLFLRIAVNASEETGQDFAATSSIIAAAVEGQTRGLKQLGISTDNADGSQRAFAATMTELIDKFRDTSAAVRDTEDALDDINVKWNQLKQSAGQALAPLLNVLLDVPTAFHSMGLAAVGVFSAMATAAVDSGRIIAKAFDIKTLIFDPAQHAENFADAIDDAGARARATMSATFAEIDALWTKSQQSQTQTAEEEAKARARAVSRFAKQDEDVAAKKAKEQAEKAVKAEAARLDRVRAIERQATLELQRERIDATQEGSEERLKAELELLRTVRQFAEQDAEESGASTETIFKIFLQARENLLAAFYSDNKKRAIQNEREIAEETLRIAREQAAIEQELIDQALSDDLEGNTTPLDKRMERELLAIAQRRDAELEAIAIESNAELAAIRAEAAEREALEPDPDKRAELKEKARKLEQAAAANAGKRQLAVTSGAAKAEREIVRLTSREKIAAGIAVADAAIGAATAIFGASKAAAIAGAIIDTWVAVNNALATVPYPYNIAVAALLAAQGLANVAKIKSTSIGSSGGGGASVGGGSVGSGASRATAPGAGGSFDSPFSDGSGRREGRSGGNTQTIDQSIHIHGNMYGGRAGKRELARELQESARRDRQRIA
jgi:hypothetical protein